MSRAEALVPVSSLVAIAAAGLRLVHEPDPSRWAFFFFSAGVTWDVLGLRAADVSARPACSGDAERGLCAADDRSFSDAAQCALVAGSVARLMTRLDVRGKSREEIAALLAKRPRTWLYDLIHKLVTVEEHFTPEEIAAARRYTKRVIVDLCKEGKIPGAHKALENGWRISQSGLEAWDDDTRVNPLPVQPGLAERNCS